VRQRCAESQASGLVRPQQTEVGLDYILPVAWRGLGSPMAGSGGPGIGYGNMPLAGQRRAAGPRFAMAKGLDFRDETFGRSAFNSHPGR
jgi:hypothetical protein